MGLVLLRSRETIGTNNVRRDFQRNMKGLRNGIWYEEIRNIYIYLFIFYEK